MNNNPNKGNGNYTNQSNVFFAQITISLLNDNIDTKYDKQIFSWSNITFILLNDLTLISY